MVDVLTAVVLAFIGGGLGSLLRWGVGIAVKERYKGNFPLGTFMINVTGAFIIAFLSTLFVIDWKDRYGHPLTVLVLTGFLGGFTTFSSYELDTAKLLGKKERATAAIYWVGSVVAGLLAAALGVWAGMLLG